MAWQFQLWFSAASVVFFDQVTKQLAARQGLVMVNAGISFGWFGGQQGSKEEEWVIGGTVVVLIALWWWGRALWQRQPVAAGLIFGGGVGNLIDRISSGGVLDWLALPGTGLRNNVADWCIVIGLLWVGTELLRRNERAHV